MLGNIGVVSCEFSIGMLGDGASLCAMAKARGADLKVGQYTAAECRSGRGGREGTGAVKWERG